MLLKRPIILDWSFIFYEALDIDIINNITVLIIK